jgi:hypothetical protein
MPDEHNGISKPGPVDVRIHGTRDPQIEVSLDPRIDRSLAPQIDVPLDQPVDDIGASSRGSSDPRSTESAAPLFVQASAPQVVQAVDPPRVDRSYPRFGQPLDPEVKAPSHRPVKMWVAVAVALVIGVLAGYVAGFMVGQRDRSPLPEVATPEGQSFTESTVPSKPPELVESPESRPVDAGQVTEAPTRPAPAVTASPVTSTGDGGSLLVRSVPSGARVVLDLEPRGVTPLALRSLSLGTHNVEVTYLGYEPRQTRVVLTPERPAQSIDFELRTTAAAAAASSAPRRTVASDTPGELRVDSRPKGARVLLDNAPVGTTPLLLPGIRPGSHKVRLEMQGYYPWSTSVNVDAGGRARVAASLETQENR